MTILNIFRLFLVLSLSAWSARATAFVQVTNDSATVENEFLQWRISLTNGKAKTCGLTNRRTGESIPIEGEDFVLEFADGHKLMSSDFQIKKATTETSSLQAEKLLVSFEHKPLQVRLVIEIRPGQWWARRYLEITGASGRLKSVTLAQWKSAKMNGPAGRGETVETLGYPSGCGQPVYFGDFFGGIAHPGAENFATTNGLECRLPTDCELISGQAVKTRGLVIGAGEVSGAREAFIGYIKATRAVPARMIFLVNDWYWQDKSRPLQALQALVQAKQSSGVPIDSFTLDDGWDLDWDPASGLWGRLNRQRFPGGWDALQTVGRPVSINLSLWFGPIGGYGTRQQRVNFGRAAGYEINSDKLCLAGPQYRRHVIESFSQWAGQGMDYIKVDGFWPDCPKVDHGHPVGSGGAVSQMDALMETFAAWRKARPNLLIGYTSGSNPSPFWLQHADFVWRGGADDSHAGVGEPFDRHNTYLDTCLQLHRQTAMPISAFVTFDIVQHRIRGNSEAGFERGAWWLAARTSLHHDWYLEAGDLTLGQWQLLARVARWAIEHEQVFCFSQMVGGDPRRGEIYGFSAFHEGTGTLALRNPSAEPRALTSSLADLLGLPKAGRGRSIQLTGVFGQTQPLAGVHPADNLLRIELPPLNIAVFEVKTPK
jgi:hypothetical protein